MQWACQLTKGVKWKPKVIFKASLSGKYLLLYCDSRRESLCGEKMGGYQIIAAFRAAYCWERAVGHRKHSISVSAWVAQARGLQTEELSPPSGCRPPPNSRCGPLAVHSCAPLRAQPQIPSEKRPSSVTGGHAVKGSGRRGEEQRGAGLGGEGGRDRGTRGSQMRAAGQPPEGETKPGRGLETRLRGPRPRWPEQPPTALLLPGAASRWGLLISMAHSCSFSSSLLYRTGVTAASIVPLIAWWNLK